MLYKETERNLEEVYQSRKPYLNRNDGCEELHDMCMNCEKFAVLINIVIQGAETYLVLKTG